MSQISIEFSENHLISALATPPYSWLDAIESRLSVRIFQRGNHVILEGEEKSCQLASDCLQKLYQSAENGEFLSPQNNTSSDIISADFTNEKPHNNTRNNAHHHLDAHNLETLLESATNDNKISASKSSASKKSLASARYHDDYLLIGSKKLIPANQSQNLYLEAITNHPLTFGIGPAGTGKTHLAVGYGVKLLLEEKISHIIFARPAVEAGEKLGYLPGDMHDKVEPYFQPIYDSLYEFLGKEQTERYMAMGKIEIAPLAYMRGRTLKNAFILLDEAQNTTAGQMKMLLTRLGENSHMVINGDLSQIDLSHQQQSGLKDAINRFHTIDAIAICHFSAHDSMRHPLVRQILHVYNDGNH